jgi:GntR family transcriptional regulator
MPNPEHLQRIIQTLPERIERCRLYHPARRKLIMVYKMKIATSIITEYGKHIGTSGIAVYAILAMYAGPGDSCSPSLNTIAGDIGVSRPTVTKALDKLIEFGLVTKTSRKRDEGGSTSNLYTLNPTYRR